MGHAPPATVGGRLRAALRRFAPALDGAGLVADAPEMPVREVVRRFWPDARPYRGWIGLILLFVLLGPLVDTATIFLYQRLIDDALVPRDFAALPAIAAAYLGLSLLGGVLAFGRDYLSAWTSEHVLLGLRARLFRHLHALPLGFLERSRLGDVLTRLSDDVDEVETLVVAGPADALAAAAKIVFFAGALFYLNWRLALVALLVAPPFWWAARRFAARIKAASRAQTARTGAIAAVAEESLANAPLVHAYNRQGDEIARFERESRGEAAAQLAVDRLRALFTPLIDLLELGAVLAVVGAGVWELSEGRLSLGGLLAFLAFLAQLYDPVRSLGRLATDLVAAAAGAERVAELLDAPPAAPERPGAVALGRARGELVVEDVSLRYPEAGRDALDRVSFRLEPGQTLALVGPSGAGKSTLVKLLLRFADPDAGRIRLDGRDLRDVQLASLRENVAVLLQETLLFDGSIRENIAFGRPGATEEQVVAAAEAAAAHGFVAALPEGYETRVGQRGRSLSGGQRQRIAIARAVIRDAPLLILDEPTTGLDAETGERVLAPLRRLMRDRTTVIVSHNLLTVRDADLILVLDEGRVAERGTHHDLLARGGAYARLHALHHAAPDPKGNGNAPEAAAPATLVGLT